MTGKDLKAWAATLPDECVIEHSSHGSYYDDLKPYQIRGRIPEKRIDEVVFECPAVEEGTDVKNL